jgi:hypothetical protein
MLRPGSTRYVRRAVANDCEVPEDDVVVELLADEQAAGVISEGVTLVTKEAASLRPFAHAPAVLVLDLLHPISGSRMSRAATMNELVLDSYTPETGMRVFRATTPRGECHVVKTSSCMGGFKLHVLEGSRGRELEW